MRRYRILARLDSPLVIRRQRQSQRSEGVTHIPGTVLRGALANIYLQSRGLDATFNDLFLNEATCRFGPLDPAERVFPTTAYSCKRHPGFNGAGDGHGVVDYLVGWLQRVLSEQPVADIRCTRPGCGNDLKPITGFWRDSEGGPEQVKGNWQHSVMPHVGIDRATHTAAEAIFFTLPALEPRPKSQNGEQDEGSVLFGELFATDECVNHLREILDAESGIVRIGHARTRGYGKVHLSIMDVDNDALSTDVTAWSRQMAGKIVGFDSDPERQLLFTVSFPDGAILLDPLLRYTVDPAGMVAWLPPLPAADPDLRSEDLPSKQVFGGTLRSLTAVTRHERVRGWNAAHGLPKQDEWAVIRGAVYAYMFEGSAEGRAQLLEQLDQLRWHGVGARRNEGFGKVVICDDFHVRFAP